MNRMDESGHIDGEEEFLRATRQFGEVFQIVYRHIGPVQSVAEPGERAEQLLESGTITDPMSKKLLQKWAGDALPKV